jgi:hypothetical protein
MSEGKIEQPTKQRESDVRTCKNLNNSWISTTSNIGDLDW